MIMHQVSNSLGNYNYNAYTYTATVWDAHFHGNYELIYSAEGTTYVTVNGVSDKLLPGEMMLVSPYAIHSLDISENTKTRIDVFSKDFVGEFFQKYRFVHFSKFRCEEKVENFLKEKLFVPEMPERYMLKACLYMVCGECVRNRQSFAVSGGADFIEKTISCIAENIERDITMEEVAGSLNYEYHYFSALFHRYFSINFKKFLNILRFEQACRLLSDKTVSVTEVSAECGFGSIRNFNRIFKEFSGLTPKEYRNFEYEKNAD